MNKVYETLFGETLSLKNLPPNESEFVDEIVRLFETRPEWDAFANHWHSRIDKLYARCGLDRRQITQTIPYLLAQDLSGRLMIDQGAARASDPLNYRDQIMH